MRKYRIIILFACIGMVLTGCNGKQIFQKQTDPYAQEELSVDEIENDLYYVKSGTKFIKVGMPAGKSFNGKAVKPSRDRVVWMKDSERIIPTMYKGDVLAIKGESTNLTNVTLERFADTFYSIGIQGAKYSDGMINLSFKKNIDADTTAGTMDGITSDEIHITTINGQEVTENMVDASGVITCFSKDEIYRLGYYSGTVYRESKVTADYHYLESWEMYDITTIELTKRGYMQVELPEDLKSGWYLVQGQGFIKYIAHERGAGEIPEGSGMNENYYSSEEEQRRAYSQVYSVTFEKKTLNPTVEVVYDNNSLAKDQVIDATLVSPDGTVYIVSPGERPALDTNDPLTTYKGIKEPLYLTCALKEAIAGKWNIYISPKDLTIADVRVLSNGLQEETREDVKEVIFPEDTQNQTFYVSWSGGKNDSYISGLVIYPDGTSHNMTRSKLTDYELTYEASYLPAGTYTIKLYHYSDTEMKDAGTRDNTDVNGTEIITITG